MRARSLFPLWLFWTTGVLASKAVVGLPSLLQAAILVASFYAALGVSREVAGWRKGGDGNE